MKKEVLPYLLFRPFGQLFPVDFGIVPDIHGKFRVKQNGVNIFGQQILGRQVQKLMQQFLFVIGSNLPAGAE